MDVQNISVAVRARPLLHQEESTSSPWSIANNSLLLRASNSIYKDNIFRYATVFGPNDDNASVYSQTAAPLVESVLSGINCTLLAYGQTGSGKTHTILGSPNDPGVVPRAWAELFHEISCNKSRVFTVHATFLELYNEELRDLMDPTGDKLQVQQVRDGTCIIPGLRRFEVRSYEQIHELLQQASNNRVLSATKMNQMSSRSHALFSLIIESEALSHNDPHPHLFSTLVVVDLAGSERTAKSGTDTGVRRREREAINLSLLSLGMVISQLTETGAAGRHVNYRNSLLTRLLQVSLGGNARTCMICTITPSTAQLDESISTLRFASNATKVKNRLRVNVESSDAVKIAHLKQEVEQLKKQGLELQRRLSGTESEWGSRGAPDASWEAERSALVTDLEACRSLVRELQMENVNLQRQIKDKKKMEDDLLSTQQMVKELKKQNAVLTANLAFEREMQQQLQLLLARSQASLEDPPQYSELMQEVSHPSPSPAPHSMPSSHDTTPAPADAQHHSLSDPHHRLSDIASPHPQHSSGTPKRSGLNAHSSSSGSSSYGFSSPKVTPVQTKITRQSSGGHESGIPFGPRPQRSVSSSYTPRTPNTPDLAAVHDDYIATVSTPEPGPNLTIKTRLHQAPTFTNALSGANFSNQTSMVFGATPSHPEPPAAMFQEPIQFRPSSAVVAPQTSHRHEASSRTSLTGAQRDMTDDVSLQRKSSTVGVTSSSKSGRSRSVDVLRSLSDTKLPSSSAQAPSQPTAPSGPRLAAANRGSDSGSIPLAQSFYSGRGSSAREPSSNADQPAAGSHQTDPSEPAADDATSRLSLPSSQILPPTPSVSEYNYRPSTASTQYRSSSDTASSRHADPLRDSHSQSAQVLPRSRTTSSASLDFSSSVEFTSTPADSHSVPSRNHTRPTQAATHQDVPGPLSAPSSKLLGVTVPLSDPTSQVFSPSMGHAGDAPQARSRMHNVENEPHQPWFGHEHSSKLEPTPSHELEMPGTTSTHDSYRLHVADRLNHSRHEPEVPSSSLSQFRSMLEQGAQPFETSSRQPYMSLAERVQSLSEQPQASNSTSSVGNSSFHSSTATRGVAVRGSYPAAAANVPPVRTRNNSLSASVPITRRSLSAIAASTQPAAHPPSSIARSASDVPPTQTLLSPSNSESNSTVRSFGMFSSSVKPSSSVTSVKHTSSSFGSSSRTGRTTVDGLHADSSAGSASVPPAVRVRLHNINGPSTAASDAGVNSKGTQDGGALRKAREAAIAQRSRDAVSRLAVLRAKTEAVRKQLPAFRFS